MEEFDPRPVEYRNTAKDLLKEFLGKVKGKDLGVSILLAVNVYLHTENHKGEFCWSRVFCSISWVFSGGSSSDFLNSWTLYCNLRA